VIVIITAVDRSEKYSSSLLLIIIISSIFLNYCSGNRNIKNQVSDPVIEKKNSTFLFDWKSLDGCEITNFGPQGPVYVSGEEVIPGMGDGCTGITCMPDAQCLLYI
jgi:hypothetical protein